MIFQKNKHESQEDQDHEHNHGQDCMLEEKGRHTDTHGIVDPSIPTTQRGIGAVKWSFVGLGITAIFQMIIVYYTGSIFPAR